VVSAVGSLSYGIAHFSLGYVSELKEKAPLFMTPLGLLALIFIKLWSVCKKCKEKALLDYDSLGQEPSRLKYVFPVATIVAANMIF